MEINFLVFDTAPKTLDKYIVKSPTTVSGDLKMYFIWLFENDVLEHSVFFTEKL